MFAFETTAESLQRDIRRRIECCLETGNYNDARTLMIEYEAEFPMEARNLRTELVPVYNVHI